MDRQHHPHSTLTMVRPVFTDPVPTPPPGTGGAPSPAAKPPAARAPSKAPAETEIFSQAEAPEALFFQPETAVPGMPGFSERRAPQEIFCQCGEALLVGFEDAGQNLQCPTCGLLMEVELDQDALRVRPIGKVVEDTWTLDDFK
jgi:hypothetical protein